MKILVTGANGQLGSEINFLHAKTKHQFTFIDIEELDLTVESAVKDFLNVNSFDWIINCAAFTNVDGAEDQLELAEKLNTHAPKILAQHCAENESRLVHISTDYVFGSAFNHPIKEDDKPAPESVYGKTKLAGEQAVMSILPNAYIIRTSWVYSSYGNNFVKTMLRLGAERDELNVVNDQIGTPTYARDLAQTILTIINETIAGNDQPGIYHFSNEGVCSWYDFAFEIMKLKNINCQVNPIPTSAFPTKAKRPSYSLLDKSKIKKQFNLLNNHWTESLEMMLSEFKS